MVVELEDHSFKKPGSVPFKWEIKPGLPITQQQNHHHPKPPSLRLRPPPPIGSYMLSPAESRRGSFRSSSRVRSDRWQFERPLVVGQPESVSLGCFFSPFLKRLGSKKRVSKRVVEEPDYKSELETLSRWSFSSTKSNSPFRASMLLSSVASSPRPVSNTEWAGFGLF